MDMVSFGRACATLNKVKGYATLNGAFATRIAHHGDKKEWKDYCKRFDMPKAQGDEQDFLKKFGKGI